MPSDLETEATELARRVEELEKKIARKHTRIGNLLGLGSGVRRQFERFDGALQPRKRTKESRVEGRATLYRDELESRRAHVTELEAQLAGLEHEEAVVRSWASTAVHRVIESTLFVETGALSERDVLDIAEQVFEVPFQAKGNGAWCSASGPGGRQIEVRLTSHRSNAIAIDLRDDSGGRTIFLRALVSAFLIAVPMLIARARWHLRWWMLALVALASALIVQAYRQVVVRARRRAYQRRSFEQVLNERRDPSRVRVADDESEDDALNQAEVAKRAMKADR